jgi:hypothetical protein
MAFAALYVTATSVFADEPKLIHIQVDGSPQFDVIYHRALTNNTGGAIAGLIGAGIQAGIESDKDAKKRAAVSSHIKADVWNEVFVKSLNEAFLAKGYQPVWDADGKSASGAGDLQLVLSPDSYGFRMVDTSTALVSAFVQFQAVYAHDRTSLRKQSEEVFYLTSKKQQSYDDLIRNVSELEPDLEAVLAQSARRLANKIIYNAR